MTLRAHRFGAGAVLAALALLPSPQPLLAQGDSWQDRPGLLMPRRLLAAAAQGGLIYTFGGCGSPCFEPPFHTSTFEETRVEVFDPGSGAWTVRRPMPSIFFGGAAAAPGDGRIYVAGGTLTGNALLEYDPAADAWAARAPMPTARHGLALAVLGGEIYAVGGSTGANGGAGGAGASAVLEIYDPPPADAWRIAAPMPTARVFLAAAAVGGKLYALGGSPDCCGKSRTAAVEAYDPATGRWQARAPLPVALQVSAAATVDGKIYVFGGHIPGSDGDGARRFTFEYDPAADAWTARAPMPTARDQAPAAVVGGKAYVLGGSIECHCRALDDNEEYTPPTPPPADLAIRKTDGRDEVIACTGPEIIYTVTASNSGPRDVAGASVADAFPASLTCTWTCVGAGGGTCAASGSGNIADTVNLPAGASGTYTATCSVSADATGTLVNTATVTPPAGVRDRDLGNNRATDRTSILTPEDLVITKFNGVDEVFACEETTYALHVCNPGPCPVRGATVHDDLPPQLADRLWCKAPSGEEICMPALAWPVDDTVDLAAGECVTYLARGLVEPAAEGTVSNTATVAFASGVREATDEDPIVHRTADLVVTKTDGVDEIWSGETVTYTITVTNEGPSGVVDAEVRDVFSEELLDVLWCAGNGCIPSLPGPIVDRVSLKAGETLEYTVTATVAPDFSGRLCNTVTVTPPCGVVDPTPADSTATDCDRVRLKDCNKNGIADSTDLADGTSLDINGDGVPDECQLGNLDWVIRGTALGGTVTITIEGFFATCTVMVATTAGDGAAAVAAALAAALNADACLSSQGIVALAHGTTLWVDGFLLTPSKGDLVNTDPGLEFKVPLVKIPTLSEVGLALLALFLAVAGARLLSRSRRRC